MWLSEAQKYFPNSQKTIIRWLDEIIAYFDRKDSGQKYFRDTNKCGNVVK
jgi:hypothetical protein